tara:strand:+ start:395 stop:673 length:279 start_codon:yes stop_codon:yes gene_type:complete
MSNETIIQDTRVIRFFNGGSGGTGVFTPTATTARNIREFRSQEGLTGTISVNEVVVSDDHTLRGRETDDAGNVTYEGDKVAHVPDNKTGGNN